MTQAEMIEVISKLHEQVDGLIKICESLLNTVEALMKRVEKLEAEE